MKERKVFLYFSSPPPPPLPPQKKEYPLTVLNSAELFGTSEMIHLQLVNSFYVRSSTFQSPSQSRRVKRRAKASKKKKTKRRKLEKVNLSDSPLPIQLIVRALILKETTISCCIGGQWDTQLSLRVIFPAYVIRVSETSITRRFQLWSLPVTRAKQSLVEIEHSALRVDHLRPSQILM